PGSLATAQGFGQAAPVPRCTCLFATERAPAAILSVRARDPTQELARVVRWHGHNRRRSSSTSQGDSAMAGRTAPAQWPFCWPQSIRQVGPSPLANEKTSARYRRVEG